MCGIAGIVRISPAGEAARAALQRSMFEAIPEQWLDVLDAGIRHRGPDGQGRFRDRAVRADGCVVDVALVHRRLSIIDHACGAQPMVSLRGPQRAPAVMPGVGQPGGGVQPLIFHGKPNDAVNYQPLPVRAGDNLVATVFNGCIYNHRELRAQLQAAGHRFETDHSDTEVLLHGWREWGDQLPEHLDGMYAHALWDRHSGSIHITRDRFGEKPLYAISSADGTVHSFASSPPALLRLATLVELAPQLGPLMNREWLQGWIRFGWNQGVPFGKTIWTGSSHGLDSDPARKSALGWSPVYNRGWWYEALNPSRETLSAETVEEILRSGIHERIEADVPIGCFLSGGIDSALIATFAREKRPDLTAFTVRMPGELDESVAAAHSAAAIGVRHEILDCHAAPAEDLQRLICELGLPFGDSSLLPTHWVSRAARQRVAVALSGDGGDDLFLGYERHRVLRALALMAHLPRSLRGVLAAAPLSSQSPRSFQSRLHRFIQAAASGGYKELLAIFPSPMDEELGLGCFSGGNGLPHFGFVPKHGEPDDQVLLSLRLDRMFYLPEDLLRKTDTASMSCALEVRAPFLANGVAQRAMNASISSLMPRGQRKGLLRQVARKYLPADIVDRPKQGFAIPIGEWFRSDYGGLRTLLLDRLNSAEPFGSPSLGIDLNMAFVRQMLEEHLGTGKSGFVKRDHSQRLYMLLVLSIWADWMGRIGRGV